jgi:hypothetical protein
LDVGFVVGNQHHRKDSMAMQFSTSGCSWWPTIDDMLMDERFEIPDLYHMNRYPYYWAKSDMEGYEVFLHCVYCVLI